MTIPITGQPPVPSLAEPATFNTKALNLFTWITGSMLDQFNNVDAADWFGIATQIEAEAGTDNTKILTALRTKQAIDQFAATKAQGDLATAAIPSTVVTTRGDLLYRGASAVARLPKGTLGQVMTQGADDPVWGAFPFSSTSYPSRSMNTPYLNNTGRTMFVGLVINQTGTGTNVYAKTGPTASPTVIAAGGYANTGGRVGLSLMVKNGDYYRVETSGGGAGAWVIEYTQEAS
jgi:hypothetical protein